jgi:hypothetical protein
MWLVILLDEGRRVSVYDLGLEEGDCPCLGKKGLGTDFLDGHVCAVNSRMTGCFSELKNNNMALC